MAGSQQQYQQFLAMWVADSAAAGAVFPFQRLGLFVHFLLTVIQVLSFTTLRLATSPQPVSCVCCTSGATDLLKPGYQDQEDALVKSMLSFDSDSEESHCQHTVLSSEPSVGLPDTPTKRHGVPQPVRCCWQCNTAKVC